MLQRDSGFWVLYAYIEIKYDFDVFEILMMFLIMFMSLWFMKLRQKVGFPCLFSMLKSHIHLIINRNWVIVKVIVIDQRIWCIKLVLFVLLVKEIEVLSRNNFWHVVHQQPQWLAPYYLSRLTFRLFVIEWKSIKEISWDIVRYQYQFKVLSISWTNNVT